MTRALVLFLALLCVSVTVRAQTWTISNPHLATILMGVDCTDDNTCWISGDSSSGNTVLYTNNAASTWTPQHINFDSVFMFCTAMGSSVKGVSTGLGLFGAEGSAFTVDGQNWNITLTPNIFEAFQDCGAIDANTYYRVGQWSTVGSFSGNGVQISTDGGADYTGFDWGQNTTARYGHFINATFGYIAGGQWPSAPAAYKLKQMARTYRPISQRLHYADGHLVELSHDALFNYPLINEPRVEATTNITDRDYVGIISKTADGGNTWQQVFYTVGEKSIYFNAIFCTDANTCWAVGEGVNSTNSLPAAYIIHTTNGGQTWTEQLYVEYGSLIEIKMLNANEGWAVGGDKNPNSRGDGQFWHTTNGGSSWTADLIPGVYPLDISIIDSTHAFAVGTQGQRSSVFKYA